jgi:predicted ester cyclase
MSAEENRAIIDRAAGEIWNKGSVAAIEEYMDPEIVDHNPAPGQPPGIEGQKAGVLAFRAAFPDLRTTNDDIIAAEDKVVLRWSGRGTHTGELFGIPPTGREVAFTGIEIYRLANGKIVERWGEFDQLGILQQLGVIPGMEK